MRECVIFYYYKFYIVFVYLTIHDTIWYMVHKNEKNESWYDSWFDNTITWFLKMKRDENEAVDFNYEQIDEVDNSPI